MDHQSAIAYILDRLSASLPDNLVYHSIDHTHDVLKSAKEIAEAEGIKGEDLELLMTAVAYHDSGFILSYSNHELNSCDLAAKHLPDFGYSEDQIKTIQGLIMSTKVPQDARTHLGQILCDADLDYLGKEDYDEVSQGLFEELRLNGKNLSQIQWLELQIQFLEEHHYWTEYSKKHRDERKAIHLQRLKSRLQEVF